MNWLFEVTDLKQYVACPRIVYYRYCLPQVRPITGLMEEGIRRHEEEDAREGSATLGLSGRIDLVIATPSRDTPNAEGIVVEYKYSEQKAGPHFALQLAAYALLLEEAWSIPVKRGYLYSIPLRRAELVPITPHLRKKVVQTVQHIQQVVTSELMPAPPSTQYRCVTCEFHRFCNDVV